ncbi:MAG: methanogenesis marker protein Mmp4/MtxX [Candidatus Hodarchaeota archaeon]
MITEKLIKFAKQNPSKIAIGVGENPEYIKRTAKVAERATENKIANIVLIGKKAPPDCILEFIKTDTPEKSIINLLIKKKVDGIVRGSLSSSKFLNNLKKSFEKDVFYRLALLETAETSHQFLFSPVGIDECKNSDEKLFFVKEGSLLLKKLEIQPKIAVLSGGREEDKKRGSRIAKTIDEAIKVVERASDLGITNIKNYNILIENAIKEKANLIIAPEGIAGNLIYRTLVHLGAGKSHGAVYLGLNRPVIDTSRVGPEFEYFSAIAFASTISFLQKK